MVHRDPTQINSAKRKGGGENLRVEKSKSNFPGSSNLDFHLPRSTRSMAQIISTKINGAERRRRQENENQET